MAHLTMISRALSPAIGVALLAIAPAFAQEVYPNRTIKIVVPLPAGPFPDVVTRIVASKLQERFGHPVVVENRPGAANNIGAEAVAKSPPDGYTLLSAPQGPFVIAQHFFRNLAYDPTAFVPVTVLAKLPYTFIAHPKAPYSTLSEFIAYAKSNPDKVTYASAGTGGQPHLIGAMLQSAAGIRIRHVPYKGLPPAMNDLVGGHVDVMFDSVGNALPQIKEWQGEGACHTVGDAAPGAARRAGNGRDLSRHGHDRLVCDRRPAPDTARDRDKAVESDQRSAEAARRGGAAGRAITPLRWENRPRQPRPFSRRNPRSGGR